MKVATLMNTPAADGLFQKGIIESGVYEASIYQKEDGDGTEIVKALLEELKLDASEIEKLETIPYYELANAYNKVEKKVAAKGCYIGQAPGKRLVPRESNQMWIYRSCQNDSGDCGI